MTKKFFVFVLLNFIFQTVITYSLEGINKDYDKIYQVTVSIDELHMLTNREKRLVEKIYKNYKKEINKINNKDISFEKKQILLDEVTRDKDKKIKKILNEKKYNKFQEISENIKKMNLYNIDRKNEILNSMDLSNEQIYYILKYDKKFKREVEKMLVNDSIEDKASYYEMLRNQRDTDIENILDEKQILILQQFEINFEKK